MQGLHKKEVLACFPLRLELHWSGQELLRLDLSFCRPEPAPEPELSSQGAELRLFLKGYLQGQAQAPPGIRLAWAGLSSFQALVLSRLQAQVPKGEQVSYQGLAELCGRAKAARAVGRVMAKNPWPLLIPCHRVLGKGGKLGGFSSGLELKRFLLDLEGIAYRV